MNIRTYPLGQLKTNCYLVSREQSKEAVIIDAGMDPEELIEAAADYTIKAVLLTHAHFDHIAGLTRLREAVQAPVYIHAEEQAWLVDPELNGSAQWPAMDQPVKCERAEYVVTDGQILELAGFRIQVLYTPGHSPGGVSYLFDEGLFCGDALFAGSIGRTDLFGGDFEQLMESIFDKLLPLPDETVCYPGHGPVTTIGRERNDNPFL